MLWKACIVYIAKFSLIVTMVYDAISMPYPKAKAARPPKVGASEVSCGCFDWVRDIDVLATYYRFAGN